MKSHFRFGAIDKNTFLYTKPDTALKEKSYKCPVCQEDVILKQGEIRRHHFSHHKNSKCTYYDNPTESDLHKNGKLIMKLLIETRKPIKVYRNCFGCNKRLVFTPPIFTDTSNVLLEHSFEYSGKQHKADVAHLEENGQMTIYEIFKCHRTLSSLRPEPWYEIDARALNLLYSVYNLSERSEIILNCIRIVYCDTCKNLNEIVEVDEKTDMSDISEIIAEFKDVESVDKHITYLKEYDEKYQCLDMDYEWLKTYIEDGCIELDYHINRKLMCIQSWVEYMIDYIEDKNNIKFNQKQYECIFYTFYSCTGHKKDNIFCQGEAGTGKSVIVDAVKKLAKLLNIKVHCKAPTGLAAKNISGNTLYKFVKSLKKQNYLSSSDIVIVDEISMVSIYKFTELANEIGNTQLLVFGDFAQFPPVNKNKEKNFHCVYSPKWRIDRYIELTEIVRQKDDSGYKKILQGMRRGNVDDDTIRFLASRIVKEKDIVGNVQHVFFKNEDVCLYNRHQMELLEDPIKEFIPDIVPYGNFDSDDVSEKLIQKYTIELNVGCEIFVTKNINEILVNGYRGTIKEIESEKITIEGEQGELHIIEKRNVYIGRLGDTEEDSKEEEDKDDNDEDEEKDDRQILYAIKQFPLKPSYGCTLYKVQGQTLLGIVYHIKPHYYDKDKKSKAKIDINALYVVASRVIRASGLFIVMDDDDGMDIGELSREQKALIEGHIHPCKGCKILMRNDDTDTNSTVHFCEDCGKVPFDSPKEYRGLLIENVIRDTRFLEFFEEARHSDNKKWKNFVNGVENMKAFYKIKEHKIQKKCVNCRDKYPNPGYDTCWTCSNKRDKSKSSSKASSCYKCGRKGHFSSSCYAKTHIKGHKLNL